MLLLFEHRPAYLEDSQTIFGQDLSGDEQKSNSDMGCKCHVAAVGEAKYVLASKTFVKNVLIA